MSFNKLIVVGNLTRDPELRYTQKGTPVCTVNVASNDRSRDPRTQEVVDTPTFFRATVWGQKAETVAQHFEKGSEIYIEGRFKPEEWTDREGRQRVTFGIQVSDFNFTGGSNRGSNRAATARPASTQAQASGSDEDDIDFS
jgi:single-strand DNA-binding protein